MPLLYQWAYIACQISNAFIYLGVCEYAFVHMQARTHMDQKKL